MRRALHAAAVLVVVLAVGVLVSITAGDSRDSASDAPDSLDGPVAPHPVLAESTTPTAEFDLDGARRAGIAAVSATGQVAHAGFISRRELIESFTTSKFGPVLADETSAQLRDLAGELGSRDTDAAAMSVFEQPVSAIASVSDRGAVVEVYSVLVVAVPRLGPARQVWRTVRLEMVDVEGRWVVDGWSSEPGPTPALAAEAVIDDAELVAGRLAWPPAVGAGG